MLGELSFPVLQFFDRVLPNRLLLVRDSLANIVHPVPIRTLYYTALSWGV